MPNNLGLTLGLLIISLFGGCGGEGAGSAGLGSSQLSAKAAASAVGTSASAASATAITTAASIEPSDVRARALVALLTQDEKLQLIHSEYAMSQVPGGGAGYIQGVPRLNIPSLNMVDSSTGSGSTSQPSTTFPATLALAASWDKRLAYEYGAQVATQIRAQGFSMGLGGGTNLA